MPESDQVIQVEQLTKYFGKFQALKGLDLCVDRREVHGFLGPNGAGKSTTIRVLLGLLRASGGRVRLLDGDPWRDVVDLHRRLAYVPGDVSLWPGMTGGEAIDLLASLRGGIDERRRAELLERFELDPAKRGRQYSKGNRQKVAIVAALASDVELLILDEPTSGLDPLMEAVFQEVVGEAKDRGVTVLLSSHILSEVEALADRISIIRDGRIVQTGTLDQLRGHARTSIHAVLERLPDGADGTNGADSAGSTGQTDSAAEALRRIAVLDDVHLDGRRLTASVDSARITEAMTALTAYGFTSLTVAPPSLESLFLSQYENTGDARDAR